MSRRSIEDRIAEIYAGTDADVGEMTQLRARIDEVQGQGSGEHGSDDDLVDVTSKSFDVTKMLVEEGIYKTWHRGAGPVDQGQLRRVLVNVATRTDYWRLAAP